MPSPARIGAMVRRVALYARVSTSDRRADLQLHDLRRLAKQRGQTVTGEHVDLGVSGAKDRRPELDRLVNDAHKRRFDVLAIWKLDRLARSVRHLIMLGCATERRGESPPVDPHHLKAGR